MTDIFEEVEEEVRKDRMTELWRRFGWIAWLVAIVIVGGVALNEFVLRPSAENAAADRARLIEDGLQALEDGRYGDAETAFTTLIETGDDVGPMASNYLARVRLEGNGDAEAARSALVDAVADDGGAFANLALLKAAYMDSATASRAELEPRLAPLVETESALGLLAEELLAAKSFEEGDYETARREFNRLRFAANAPQGLVQRASIALDAIPPSTPASEETEAETGQPGADEDTVIEGNP